MEKPMARQGSFPIRTVEEVQTYWDRRPCNIRHSPQPRGSREYFDEGEARKYFVEPHIPAFADFPRWKGKKVLEIGCGIGADTMNFARHGAQVTAVELSEESLAVAKQRARVFGFENRIRFLQGNAEELTSFVPVEKYDLIYSFGVIHHTPNPERVLQELRQYCGDDSQLRIMLYHTWAWKCLWILCRFGQGRFWKADEIIARHAEAQTGCPVAFTYSKKSAGEMLRRNGFEPTETIVDHIFPYSIPEYKQHQYKKVWYFRWIPRPIFRWMERCFGWHVCLTTEPIRDADAAIPRAA
ncbi:MAG: class I SAM-dependent methyltransferase [Planctomycetales bacterium]